MSSGKGIGFIWLFPKEVEDGRLTWPEGVRRRRKSNHHACDSATTERGSSKPIKPTHPFLSPNPESGQKELDPDNVKKINTWHLMQRGSRLIN